MNLSKTIFKNVLPSLPYFACSSIFFLLRILFTHPSRLFGFSASCAESYASSVLKFADFPPIVTSRLSFIVFTESTLVLSLFNSKRSPCNTVYWASNSFFTVGKIEVSDNLFSNFTFFFCNDFITSAAVAFFPSPFT